MAASTVLLSPRTDQYDALVSWVFESRPAGQAVLDVGAGDGDMDYPDRLRPIASRIVGVDPSEGIAKNLLVDHAVQATIEEFALNTEETFDVAVAVYVVEHVEDPPAFLSAVARLLEPGGSLFLLTPSQHHYFGAAAALSHRLHIDEWLLERIRDEHTLHEHHFGIQYAMNTRKRLEQLGTEAGFRQVEFRMIDEPGIYQPYFPSAMKWLPTVYSSAVHRMGATGAAGTILACLTL